MNQVKILETQKWYFPLYFVRVQRKHFECELRSDLYIFEISWLNVSVRMSLNSIQNVRKICSGSGDIDCECCTPTPTYQSDILVCQDVFIRFHAYFQSATWPRCCFKALQLNNKKKNKKAYEGAVRKNRQIDNIFISYHTEEEKIF